MIYTFSLGGIRIRCDVPNSLSCTACTIPFLLDTDEYDILFRCICVDDIDMDGNGSWHEDVYYTPAAVYFCPVRGKSPYAKVYWANAPRTEYVCEYTMGSEYLIASTLNVIKLLSLERLFLSRDSLILHASFIRFREQGILFSAPSGTGKSTQATLWETYEGAEVLNGDRALLRRIAGGWSAYGLPMAGSSGIYRNESAPLKAIVILGQAKENRIRRLSAAETLRHIYPEVTMHRWDSEFVNTALNLLMDLMRSVPVYYLECLPDSTAVQLLKDTIFP